MPREVLAGGATSSRMVSRPGTVWVSHDSELSHCHWLFQHTGCDALRFVATSSVAEAVSALHDRQSARAHHAYA